MIAFLRGILADRQPHRVLIDVSGVGYEVQIPLSCYDHLPSEGAEVKLLTHFVVREQEQTLYGFMKNEERDLFSLLIGRVTGVGPKIALAVLSGMGIDEFKAAVVAGDITALSGINGIGKKTAERMVFELKDKLGVADAWEGTAATGAPDSPANDALLALLSLGYKQADAARALKRAQGDAASSDGSSDLLRLALRQLN